MEGFYRKLSKYIDSMKAADYTTLFRRIRRINIEVPETLKDRAVIAVDSTGIKVTNRGEWTNIVRCERDFSSKVDGKRI